MSFFIKDIEIKGKVILAPMAGVTSFSYRKTYSKFQPSLFYTEMISDCGLIYDNGATKKLCYTDKTSDRPLALQLFGGSKENLLKAIDILENNYTYDILDLNLACPMPKVTKNNGGSSWLIDLDKLKDMLVAVVKKSSKPVSCKIRLGYNENNVENIVKVIEESGASFIAIHARTRKELYSGVPHYDALKNIKNIIKIPFAVSGNIFSIEDAKKALEITKADAILVARGGIGDPLFIRDLNNYFLNKPVDESRDFLTQYNLLKEFINNLVEEFGEKKALSLLKGLAPKYFLKIPRTKSLRNEISTKIKNINDIFDIINKFIIDNNIN